MKINFEKISRKQGKSHTQIKKKQQQGLTTQISQYLSVTNPSPPTTKDQHKTTTTQYYFNTMSKTSYESTRRK